MFQGNNLFLLSGNTVLLQYPGLTWYSKDAGLNRKVEVGVFYFNYSWIPDRNIAIILLSTYNCAAAKVVSELID